MLNNTLQKMCDTLPHPRVEAVEPLWLNTINFKDCMSMQYVFLQYYRAHYDINVLIVWS